MTRVIRIDALIMLDFEGSRFFAKYYDETINSMTASNILEHEKKLFTHFKDIVNLDEMKDGAEGRTIHFNFSRDLLFQR